MSPDTTLISVIVPIYNVEKYLDQCLESIESQTYPNLEIICINDGSTDNSLAIVRKHAARDLRILVIDKENQGYGAACNQGVAHASGDYISIVEPDDWIERNAYYDMSIFASQFTEDIDIIKCAYWRIIMPDTPQQKMLYCSYKNRVHPPRQPFIASEASHILRHHPSIWSALYRRDFLLKEKIEFPEIPGAGWADNPFFIETLCKAKTIIYLDEAYYCYREETADKRASFVRNNTFIPFARWNDMADIIDKLEVTNRCILDAHYHRGFTYYNGVVEEVGLMHPGVKEAAVHMFSRMDKDMVFGNPEIPPDNKKVFAQLLGIPEQRISYFDYAKTLIKRGFYTLSNTGASNTLASIRSLIASLRNRT